MYVDLAGLARYKSDFGAWARGALLPKDAAAARVRTAKAGAVSFVPVQETPLDVSVDFLFAETPPASGDKGPDNPSTITGVSSVNIKRFGKNCCILSPNKNKGVLDFTVNSDGTLRVYGTVTNPPYTEDYITLFHVSPHLQCPDYFKRGMQYTATFNSTDSRLRLQLYSHDGSAYRILATVVPGNSATITIPMDMVYGWFRIQGTASETPYDGVCEVQIELGSQATEMELPAVVDSFDIPLGSTYYGGTLDVATGKMTVTWVAVELNGTETWDDIGNNYNSNTGIGMTRCYPEYLNLRKWPALDVTANSFCTHFSYLGNFGGTTIRDGTVTTPRMFYTAGTSSVAGQARFAVPYSDVADFKTWLAAQKTAGTPVMLTYKIYEPFTVQLTPTEILSLTQSSDYDPRLNTVYSDQQAVQVGYLKHPSAASADLRSALVSLGGGV